MSPFSRVRWQVVIAVLWLVLLLGVSLRSALMPQRQNIWPTFAAAGQRWLHGENLYGVWEPGLDLFRYSPLAAAVLAPLSLLPACVVNPLWRLLNAGVLLAGLAWWCRSVVPLPWTQTQRAWLLLLVIPFALPSLNNGQVNPLVLGFLLSGVAAAFEQRWWLAATFLTVAGLFKVYPLAVALLLVLFHPCQLGPRLLLTLVVGLALPLVLQHPGYVVQQYAAWVEHLLHGDRPRDLSSSWLRDFRLLLLMLDLRLSPPAWLGLQFGSAASCALVCLATRLRRNSERMQLRLATALACGWMTVFGPATESCTWLLLAPPLLTDMLQAWTQPGKLGQRSWLLTSFLLLVLPLPLKWFTAERWLAVLWLPTAGGVLYLVAMLRESGLVRRLQPSIPF